MGKPSAPTPPDPNETAGAQTANNIGTAIAQQNLNNVNQVTPDGTLTYNQTGTTTYVDPNDGTTHYIPQYTATQTLSADQQAIKDQQDAANLNFASLAANQSGRIDDLLERPIDLNGLPERVAPATAKPITETYGTDFSADRQRVEDALMERMQPGLERDKAALEARLASQGIQLGSEAYSAAMEDYGRQTNDARLSAILGAGQEQSRLTGLEAQRAGFENAAQSQDYAQRVSWTNAQNANRDAALQEAFATRSQPINEITALLSGSQVQNPNFVSTPQTGVATTDYAGIVGNNYAQEMNAYNQQMASRTSILNNLLGIGGTLLSDRRAKKDIKKVGKLDDGQKVYSYRYKTGGPIQLGLMAQEVEKKKPEAVKNVGGIRMVDYGKAVA